jgi:plastocyanin
MQRLVSAVFSMLITLMIVLATASTPARAAGPMISLVEMTNFAFAPKLIHLPPESPVILRMRNDASGPHSFSAPEFFTAARVDPASARLLRNGSVEVAPHTTVDVLLIPAAGKYAFKCGRPLHAMFGMRGTILVQ